MSLHLITGYAGTEHVTAANAGALNSHSFGTGRYVFNSGEKFKAEIVSNNDVRIYDGEGLFNGRFFNMISGTYEDLTIDNGTQSMYRNDLIVARYQMDEDTGIESIELTVIKGEESSSAAVDPAYNDVSILDGNAIADFPLYRVALNGLSIDSVTALFSTIDNTNDQLDSLKENLTRKIVATSTANLTTDVLKNAIAIFLSIRNSAFTFAPYQGLVPNATTKYIDDSTGTITYYDITWSKTNGTINLPSVYEGVCIVMY